MFKRLLLAVCALLVIGLPGAPGTRAAVDDNVVRITDSGFQPSSLVVKAGESVHWLNESSQGQQVLADNAAFDSGALQPGAGFSVTLSRVATYAYRAPTSASFVAEVRVTPAALVGPPGDPVLSHIPNLAFPPSDEADLSEHPDLAVEASRTRILLGFGASATVAQANAALAAAGVDVVGGIPQFGFVLVTAPDTLDFSAVRTAVERLRADSAIEFAVFDTATDASALPAPAEEAVAFGQAWQWETPREAAGRLVGQGGNWGLEAARFPQAWNLREAIQRRGDVHAPLTVVLDQSFAAHTELARMTVERLCRTATSCTANSAVPSLQEHGTHVAGIIGAEWDNRATPQTRSVGISGANPFARLHGVPVTFGSSKPTAADSVAIMDLILNAIEPGRLADTRIINYSRAREVAKTWWQRHPTPRCGPGDHDDGTPGATEWCTPNNDDSWLREAMLIGHAARTVAQRAGTLDVLIVQATGNYSQRLCRTGPPWGGPCPAGPAGFVPLKAENIAEYAWAANHWLSGPGGGELPGRPLSVEAHGRPTDAAARTYPLPASPANLGVPAFSNPGGDLAAPGVDIVSTRPGNTYGLHDGTSLAAPHVSALVGYALAFDPNQSVRSVRDRIKTWAQPAEPGGAARIDAFATMLSLPGAARMLVDVNDDTLDGNQRTVRRADGSVERELGLGPSGGYTEPDGKIDMRDFRRYRDAWLQTCVETRERTGALPAGCPTDFEAIVLDGGSGNPKKDLNADGCVHFDDAANCLTPETVYARVDFNGDGEVARGRTELMPLTSAGVPADHPAAGMPMTDLTVLATQWEPDLAQTEGWSAAQLDSLLVSGDLEIHADDLRRAATGPVAADIDITVRRVGSDALPARKLAAGQPYLVVTAPLLTETNDEWEIRGSVPVGPATSGRRAEAQPVRVKLQPGQDRRVDLCGARLTLQSTTPVVPADGRTTATINGTLTACTDNPHPLPGVNVQLGLAPAGSSADLRIASVESTDATLSTASAVTDASGRLSATFTPGSNRTTYRVTASADLGDARTTEGELSLEVVPPLVVRYAWRQTTLDWTEEGATDWAEGLPNGGCTVFQDGASSCVRAYRAEPDPEFPSPTLERRGTLQSGARGLALTEELDQAWQHYVMSYKPDTLAPEAMGSDPTWRYPLEARTADSGVRDYPVDAEVSVAHLADRVEVRGLSAIGELSYPVETRSTKLYAEDCLLNPPACHGQSEALQTNAVQPPVLLVARGDGSALQYASDLSQPLALARNPDGTLQSYSSCVTPATRTYTLPPQTYAHAWPAYRYPVEHLYEPWTRYPSALERGEPQPAVRGAVPAQVTIEAIDRLPHSAAGREPVTFRVRLGSAGWPAGQPVTLSTVGLDWPDQFDHDVPFEVTFDPSPTVVAPAEVTVRIAPPPGMTWAPIVYSTLTDPPSLYRHHPFRVDGTSSGGDVHHATDFIGQRLDQDGAQSFPAPVGTGHLRARYAFAATAGYGSAPEPVLPDCSSAQGVHGRARPLELAPLEQTSVDPAVPALVVSPARAQIGQSVTIVNRSRDANGLAIGATLTLGDGSPVGTLPANGGLAHVFGAPGTYDVSLTAGGVAVTRSVVVEALPADFSLVLAPTSQVLAPGGTTTYTLGLASLNGFNQPVSLSISGLPAGVSGAFEPPVVTPTGSATLQLTAAPNATPGTFTLTIGASGGGRLHTTDSVLTLNFGLVPTCYGAATGRVTERDSGLPIVGAHVSDNGGSTNVLTDADGRYALPGLSLGFNNAPRATRMSARQDGFWDNVSVLGTLACGSTTTFDIQLIRVLFGGTVVGTVTEGARNPDGSVSSTGVPIVSAEVLLDGVDDLGPTDVSGRYRRSAPLSLDPNNAPRLHTVFSEVPGYWPQSSLGTFTAQIGVDVVQDLTLLKQCTSSIAGSVSLADTGQPLGGALVAANSPYRFYTALTDPQGRFSFPAVLGGPNNLFPITFALSVVQGVPAGYQSPMPVPLQLSGCGEARTLDLALPPVATEHVATVSGHLRDSETNQPLGNATLSVTGSPFAVLTDASGAFAAQVTLGTLTSREIVVFFQGDAAYWDAQRTVTIAADQTVNVDVLALRRRFGRVTGTVRDAATRLLLSGVLLSIGGATGPDGTYTSEPLQLAPGNQPRTQTVQATALEYWSAAGQTTIAADTLSQVDLDLLRVCYATVVGTVLDGLTGQPLAGADVFTRDWFTGAFVGVKTDAGGAYRLDGIRVGSNNTPIVQQISASADGFQTQQRTITAVCGGTVEVNFGAGAPTPTATPTPTASATPAPAATATLTPLSAATETPTPTATAVPAATVTPTATATAVPAATATPMPTATPVPAATETPTPTATAVPAATATLTATATRVPTTETPRPTATPTLTATAVPAATETPTATATATAMPAATVTLTPTATATATAMPAATVTVTPTGTALPAPEGPDLALAVSHLGAFTVGQPGGYTLSVTNAGDAATTGAITLTDTLPNGLSYASATGTGWHCTAAGQLVTCIYPSALAPEATSTLTLNVGVASPAVPGVTNLARVQTAGDTDPSNDADEDPTTVNPPSPADTTRPSCALTGSGTDAQGRKFILVTVQDTASGLKSIVTTRTVNTNTSWPTFSLGTRAAVVVTGLKIDQSQSSQVELRVTDVAGNVTDCDPILTTLEVGPRGRSEPQTFSQVPQAERVVTLRNGPRERTVVQILVNGRLFSATLRGGEARSIDIGAALKHGTANRVKLIASGTPGASVDVLIWDGNRQPAANQRAWQPSRPQWRDLSKLAP